MDTTEICQKLVWMTRVYAGYKVGARGPQGVLNDILRELWPELATAVVTEGVEDAYTTFFDENGSAHFNPPESELEELALSLANQVLKLQEELSPQMFADASAIHAMLSRNPLYVLRHRQIEPGIYIAQIAGSMGRWTQNIEEALRKTESQWAELRHDAEHYELVRVEP